MRIAIVGSGISGLGAARLLHRHGHAITLFEANDYLGGHTHTVDITVGGVTAPVDTGFLVFNDRTYPRLIALFSELGIDSAASEMSFSARIDAADLEWAGTSLAALFAQPRSALRPDFWRMLADIVRFNRQTTAGIESGTLPQVALGEFLDERRFGKPFRDWYLLPMAAAIWSSAQRDVLDFPLPIFVGFCHNHGLLRISDRPRWRTVRGGGRVYVAKIAAELPDVRCATPVQRIRRRARGVDVETVGRSECFDQVVLACHSDQAHRLLADPTSEETRLLTAIRYQPNRVVLHTDTALLPRSRRAWSAWNYLAVGDTAGTRAVAVSYLLNKLQPIPFATPVIVTLNPPFEPNPALTLREFEYSHPLLDGVAVAAQAQVSTLQGVRNTWYAGAWLGHGFHEDGLESAHAVAEGIARLDLTSESRAQPQRAAA